MLLLWVQNPHFIPVHWCWDWTYELHFFFLIFSFLEVLRVKDYREGRRQVERHDPSYFASCCHQQWSRNDTLPDSKIGSQDSYFEHSHHTISKAPSEITISHPLGGSPGPVEHLLTEGGDYNHPQNSSLSSASPRDNSWFPAFNSSFLCLCPSHQLLNTSTINSLGLSSQGYRFSSGHVWVRELRL